MDNVYKARNDYDFRVLKKSIKVRKPISWKDRNNNHQLLFKR